MSGVLLSVAFYAMLRVKAIADVALGPMFMRTLLLVLALATLALAAILLIGQRDYKRMLAYSSMEHMGLIALGAAIGSRLAIAAVLLHMPGPRAGQDGRCSCGSGQILNQIGSTEIAAVRGLAGPRTRCWPPPSALAWWPCSASRRSACSPANWASPAPAPTPGWLGDRRRPSLLAAARVRRDRRHAPAGCCSARPRPGRRPKHGRPEPLPFAAAAPLVVGLLAVRRARHQHRAVRRSCSTPPPASSEHHDRRRPSCRGGGIGDRAPSRRYRMAQPPGTTV